MGKRDGRREDKHKGRGGAQKKDRRSDSHNAGGHKKSKPEHGRHHNKDGPKKHIKKDDKHKGDRHKGDKHKQQKPHKGDKRKHQETEDHASKRLDAQLEKYWNKDRKLNSGNRARPARPGAARVPGQGGEGRCAGELISRELSLILEPLRSRF